MPLLLNKSKDHDANIEREQEFHSVLDHPNIVRLYHAVETVDSSQNKMKHFLLEHGRFGNLAEFLERKLSKLDESKRKTLSESDTKTIFR